MFLSVNEYPLFETLCIEQGEVKNIAYHQTRYEQALSQFYGESAVKIADLLALIKNSPESQTAPQSPLTRCRIDYNAQQCQVQFFPYTRKTYRRFQPVTCDHIDYSLKYADRTLLNQLVVQRGDCDEIMIIRDGKVTDCSIGNLIFRQGERWFTPDTPLLKGTQRQFLLDTGKITECTIFSEDIKSFDEIRLINAMNGLA